MMRPRSEIVLRPKMQSCTVNLGLRKAKVQTGSVTWAVYGSMSLKLRISTSCSCNRLLFMADLHMIVRDSSGVSADHNDVEALVEIWVTSVPVSRYQDCWLCEGMPRSIQANTNELCLATDWSRSEIGPGVDFFDFLCFACNNMSPSILNHTCVLPAQTTYSVRTGPAYC